MANAKILEAKQTVIDEITEVAKSSASFILFDYRGLTVEEDTKLRNDLRAAGVKYFVVKNTLLRLAANQVGLEELDSILHGPTALAVSEDPVAPAKILFDYAKQNDKMEIKSGFMDGKVMSMDELTTLAKTPSKETLIAKIMGSLNAPASNLVRLLNTIVEGGEEIADLIAKKANEAKEEAPAEAPAEVEAPAAEEAAPVAEATEAPAEEAAEETKETAEDAE